MHENIQITDGIYADLVGGEVKSRVTGLTTPLSPVTISYKRRNCSTLI